MKCPECKTGELHYTQLEYISYLIDNILDNGHIIYDMNKMENVMETDIEGMIECPCCNLCLNVYDFLEQIKEYNNA